MSIYVNNKTISQVFKGNRAIAAIYAGAQLVWEAIRSCFGSGMWIRQKPWLRNEGWKRKKSY